MNLWILKLNYNKVCKVPKYLQKKQNYIVNRCKIIEGHFLKKE